MKQHERSRSNLSRGRCNLVFATMAVAIGAALMTPRWASGQSTPAARFWHAFTSNGGSDTGSQVCPGGPDRLYLFGGSASGPYLDDFWYYCVGSGWVQAPLAGGKGRKPPTKPGPLGHVALSCGAGQCVLTTGTNGISLSKATWVYNEATQTWSKLACGKRNVCPSPRWGAAMAYDPARASHVLFGGEVSGAGLADTLVFRSGAWTLRAPATSPSPRRAAAAAFVPSHGGLALDRVVLYGGQEPNVRNLCDLYAWDGESWNEIRQENVGPCLESHSMAWQESIEGGGPGLVITGGSIDYDGPPNDDVWYFIFTGPSSGQWLLGAPLECDANPTAGGEARMALDTWSQWKVFFGGQTLPGSGQASDTTLVCD